MELNKQHIMSRNQIKNPRKKLNQSGQLAYLTPLNYPTPSSTKDH